MTKTLRTASAVAGRTVVLAAVVSVQAPPVVMPPPWAYTVHPPADANAASDEEIRAAVPKTTIAACTAVARAVTRARVC